MRLKVISLAILVATSNLALAKTNVEIYKADVPLASSQGLTESEQTKAWQDGLLQVLQKASGQTAPKSDAIEQAKASISHYMLGFKVDEKDDKAWMNVSFMPEKIDSLLTKSNLTVWPSERKSILVWLVQEQDDENEIAWEQSGLPVLSTVSSSAKAYGIPILYPVGDFEDVTNVSESDIRGDFITPLAKASQRYPADALLVMKERQVKDKGTEINWLLYDKKPAMLVKKTTLPKTGQVLEKNEQEAFDQVMEDLAAYFSENKAVDKSSAKVTGQVEIYFNGISRSRDIFDIQKYLEGFDAVKSAQVSNLQGKQVLMKVTLIAPQSDLLQELDQNNHFEQSSAPINNDASSQDGAPETLEQEEDALKPLGTEYANNEATVMSEGKSQQQVSAQETGNAIWYHYHQ